MEVLPQLFHTKFSDGLHEETLFIGNAQEIPSALGANLRSSWRGAARMPCVCDTPVASCARLFGGENMYSVTGSDNSLCMYAARHLWGLLL